MLPSSVVGAHIQERAYNTHFLYPRSQVWRALIEASVLDEVLLALVAHGTTVIPVEVVQVGIVFMGLCTSIGCATCIVFPRSTLKKKRKISLFELCIFIRTFKSFWTSYGILLFNLFVGEDLLSSPGNKGFPLDQALFCGVWHPYTY